MMPSFGILDLLLWGWAVLVAWVAYKVDEAKAAERTKEKESESFAEKFMGDRK